MRPLRQFLFTIFVPALFGCNTSTGGSSALFPKDTTNENERNNRLFVFVGEKIDVTPMPDTPGRFDAGVTAKYKILERVYGHYDKEVIEFEAYDHYGTPPFTKYKNALMFVSEYDGKFYQEKYMFDPLFRTKNGKWAGPYSNEYGHPYNKNTSIKPERIHFIEEVSFPTYIIDDDGRQVALYYPEPYFTTIGDKAIAVYGNYVPELFKLRKDGVLTARELFGDKKPEVEEIELENIEDTSDIIPSTK